MRTMLRIWMPAEAGNKAVKTGTLPLTMQGLVDKLKPEAAYFFPDDGKRSALFVFDLDDVSKIPTVVEPLFEGMDAEVRLTPVMNFDDLRKGLGEVSKAR